MEPLQHHMKLLSVMFNEINDSTYADETDNNSEAQWYEPWNAIFNRLRLITDWRLAVFPQPRLIRLVNTRYEGSDADLNDVRSLDGERGSDDPVGNVSEGPLRRVAQIPDFAFVFYYFTSGPTTVNFNDPTLDFNNLHVEVERHLPLIVEIKPYKLQYDKCKICEGMIEQTLMQARHTFELEGIKRQILHVMCIVGKHFFMYTVRRKILDILPKYKGEELDTEGYNFIKSIKRRVGPGLKLVLRDDQTDYSDAFKSELNRFTLECGLGISKPHW